MRDWNIAIVVERWNYSADYYYRSLNTLEIALNQVPAYASWRNWDPGKKNPVDLRYAALPALTKNDIRQYSPQGFSPINYNIQDALATGEISLVKTGGTTDDSVTNIWNQAWWNASEKSSWQLNSYAHKLATGNHREAILVNPLNVGIVSDTNDLSMEQRRLARFLYLNEKTDPLLWTEAHMERMIKELGIFQPEVLEANPSLLARLCRYIMVNNKTVFQPGLIVLTYEYPSRLHYRQIRRVFDVPIASSYGTTETGYVFLQCEEGRFHQNTEFCRVDFQPFRTKHGGPYLGRILVTTFNNPWYYMVRFDVGDIVRIEESGKCSCGRNSGMILSSVEGRWINVTLTTSGRLVTLGELDNGLSVVDGIDEYQLLQKNEDSYALHVASRQMNKTDMEREISIILQNIYGKAAKITIIHENAIAAAASGKYILSRALFPLEVNNFVD